MWWRILAVWFIADAALIASLISGSEITVRLHSVPVEMRQSLVSLAVNQVVRTGFTYAFLAGLIGLAIFPPYGSTAASIVFISATLLLGFMCCFATAMGFGNTLQRLLREESATESTPGLF